MRFRSVFSFGSMAGLFGGASSVSVTLGLSERMVESLQPSDSSAAPTMEQQFATRMGQACEADAAGILTMPVQGLDAYERHDPAGDQGPFQFDPAAYTRTAGEFGKVQGAFETAVEEFGSPATAVNPS